MFTCQEPQLSGMRLVREIKQAVLTGLSLNRLRFLSHHTGECEASFGLYR